MLENKIKYFGIWRKDYEVPQNSNGKPNFVFLVSLSICVFIVWIIFVMSVKIKKDFFLIESSNIQLLKLPSYDGNVQGDITTSVLSFALIRKNDIHYVIFDDGSFYEFPKEISEFEKSLKKRRNNIEVTAMLTRYIHQGNIRARIWPENGISNEYLLLLINYLTDFGFDIIDIAFDGDKP